MLRVRKRKWLKFLDLEQRKWVKVFCGKDLSYVTVLCAELPCPGLQQYQVCGNPCERTCRNMAEAGSTCTAHCVEGCNCPDGQALDNQGQCVPVSQCPCVFDGHEFPPGYKALKGAQLW